MRLKEFVFLESQYGFKEGTKFMFNDNKINLLIGKNGSGKSLFFESVLKAFYFLYLLDLEKHIKFQFDVKFDFSISYYLDEKLVDIESKNGKIKILVNNNKIYDFSRDKIPLDYNLYRFFPERIIVFVNSSNDKLYYISYAFEVVRKIKEHIQGFSKSDYDAHEEIRLIFININSIDILADNLVRFKDQIERESYPDNLYSLLQKSEIYKNQEFIDVNPDDFDKNTCFINSWRKLYKSINIKSYDRYGDYNRYYGALISLKDTRIAKYFEIENKYSVDRSVRTLSSGEFDYLRLFLSIDMFNERSNSLLICDEIDAHFNPKWCKEYISDLDVFLNSSSQIFITTNNPFVISDVEKINVTFFENHKKMPLQFETFGTNSNLLNSIFYDVEGTLSKRALQKIEQIRKMIDNENELSIILNELSKIGESPEKTILKYVLKVK